MKIRVWVLFLIIVVQVMCAKAQDRLYGSGDANKAVIYLTVTDSADRHVHAPGTNWSVSVTPSMVVGANYDNEADPKLSYEWVNYLYEPIAAKGYFTLDEIKAGITKILPFPANREVGWYGLRMVCDHPAVTLPGYEPNESRTWGFAVMPPHSMAERTFSLDNNMGLTHQWDGNDPYVGGGFDKTLVASAVSQPALDALKDKGMWSMPLVSTTEWNIRNRPLTAEEEKTLENYAYSIAKYTDVRMWEFGLEENLGWGRNSKDRESNVEGIYTKEVLPQKLAAVARGFDRAALETGIRTQIGYQIAEPNQRPYHLDWLLGSTPEEARTKAGKYIDVLSLHPYQWPSFSDPDAWAEPMMKMILEKVRLAGNATGHYIELWFTEVGAPEHGAYVDPLNPGKNAYFGYNGDEWNTQGKAQNRGVPSRYFATYLAKLEAIMYNTGIFGSSWYNYQDRDSVRWYPENWFGIVDYKGFPKAAYVAFHESKEHLLRARPVGMFRVGNIRISQYRNERYSGGTNNRTYTYVLWLEQNTQGLAPYHYSRWQDFEQWKWENINTSGQYVSWADLGIDGDPVSALTMLGAKLPTDSGGVFVGVDPVYVQATVPANRVEGSRSSDGNKLTIDLGASYKILSSEIKFAPPASMLATKVSFVSTKAAYKYKIELSSDRIHWITVADRTDNVYPLESFSDIVGGKAGRYVRVTILSANENPVNDTACIANFAIFVPSNSK